MAECRIRACAEKARETTLDDEKQNLPHIPYIGAVPIDRTCVVVIALCNQPEAFASNLGDDQSPYLYYKMWYGKDSCNRNQKIFLNSTLRSTEFSTFVTR